MSKKDLNENLSELFALAKSYLSSYLKLVRLEALEKTARGGTFIISSVIILMVAGFALFFLTFAFSYWYGKTYGNMAEGFLISAGFYVLLGILIFVLRRFLISRPILKSFSKTIFSKDEEEEEDE